MKESEESRRIRKSYCRPAIYINDIEWRKIGRGELPNHFHVERFVWIDALLREYRVAIAEEVKLWADDEADYRCRHGGGVQTRFVTYIPTGRQIYDNTLPEVRAVVFEYELEQYARAPEELRKLVPR